MLVRGGSPIRALVVAIVVAGALLAGVSPVRAEGGSAFVPFGPVRFVDTRIGQGIGARLVAFTPATSA